MAASNREASINKTLQFEGGFTDHPSDPGGATNWGITIHDARMYWKADATPSDVRAMPKSVAVNIYRQKYWAKLRCDERPVGVDFVDFDFGVNSGTGRAEAFRRVLDPQNLAPVAYVKAHCAKRRSFLQGLRTWSVFGKGWGRRVAEVEAYGVRMALGAAGKPLEPALKKEAAKAARKSIGSGTAGASTGAGAPALPDAIDTSSKAGLIIFGVIVACVIAYFVWNAVQHHHRAKAFTEAAK